MIALNSVSTRPVASSTKPAPCFNAKAVLQASLKRITSAKTREQACDAMLDGARKLQPLAMKDPFAYGKALESLKMAYDVKCRSLDMFETVTSNLRG
jgi:hypothetical protein